MAGHPFQLQWDLSPAGPNTTGAIVSNSLPAFLQFLGGTASVGSVFLTNGSALWSVRNLASNSAASATFGALGVSPTADPDGDGFSNQQEFTSGTDPNDSSNVLRIVSFTAESNSVFLAFFAARGHEYAIEKSASLTGAWIEVLSISGENSRFPWTGARASTNAFFRIRRKL